MLIKVLNVINTHYMHIVLYNVSIMSILLCKSEHYDQSDQTCYIRLCKHIYAYNTFIWHFHTTKCGKIVKFHFYNIANNVLTFKIVLYVTYCVNSRHNFDSWVSFINRYTVRILRFRDVWLLYSRGIKATLFHGWSVNHLGHYEQL
jgi:hypothetical protein